MNQNILWVVAMAASLVLGGCQRAKDMDGKAVAVGGSYAKTCRNVVKQPNDVVSADCLDAQGQFHSSSLPADACPGKINNVNGILMCPAKS